MMTTRFKTIVPSPLLSVALTLDAAVSGAMAALQLTAADWLSQTLLLPRALLVETGLFLVAYTVLLVVLSRSARVWSALIGVIVIGNIGWAVGCVALLASGLATTNSLGIGFAAMQAVAVLAFAALEFKGLATSLPTNDTRAARA